MFCYKICIYAEGDNSVVGKQNYDKSVKGELIRIFRSF